MSLIPITAKISAGGAGSSKAWKVLSYVPDTALLTIGYGTMHYNGKFLTSNDLLNNTISEGIGTDNAFTLGISTEYVYLHVNNPLSLPTETDKDLKISVDITTSTDAPDVINTRLPLVDYIPLAYISVSEGIATISDLRSAFVFSNFAFLAPGA